MVNLTPDERSRLRTAAKAQMGVYADYFSVDDESLALMPYVAVSEDELGILIAALPNGDHRLYANLAVSIGRGISITIATTEDEDEPDYDIWGLHFADDFLCYPFTLNRTRMHKPSKPSEHYGHCAYSVDWDAMSEEELAEHRNAEGDLVFTSEIDGEPVPLDAWECECTDIELWSDTHTISNDAELARLGEITAEEPEVAHAA